MSAHPMSRTKPLVIEATRQVRSLRIDWGISRRALGERAPVGTDPLVTLRFETRSNEIPSWVLIDPRSNERVGIDPPREKNIAETHIRIAGDCVHIHGPELYAFVSIKNPNQPELLYARTNVFERLGISGGRYQPLGARVVLY